MTSTRQKAERRYELTPDADVPDLVGGLVCVLARPRVAELHATYFDTRDLALASAGVSLRRRTGGADPGWYLTLRSDGDNGVEIRRALGRGVRVPVALRQMLKAVTIGDPLIARVSVATVRTSCDLVDDDGAVVAALSDDVLTAMVPDADGVPLQWREVEVEVVDRERPVLEDVDRALISAGVKRSCSASTLQRALEAAAPGQRHEPVSALPEKSAGDALHKYLVEQRRALTQADLAVRATGTSVHDVRVAARRIRTALTAYRPLICEATARHLHTELQWLGRALSDVRDLEVAGVALSSALDEEPDRLKAGPVRALVRRRIAAAQRPARAAADIALASERYLSLLTHLDALLVAPAWTDRASAPADKTLPQLLTKPRRRLRRAAKAAAAAEPDEKTSALHDVRKSAKRLRYAAEVAVPALGVPADRLGDAAKHVQAVVGDHLDTVATNRWLQRLGHDPDAGRAAFTFGRLHARKEQRISDQLDAYERAIEHALKGKTSRFLRGA